MCCFRRYLLINFGINTFYSSLFSHTLGGCKHAVAFLTWLHRRSEDPPTTSITCYWKKSALSAVGTSLKFIKAKELGKIKIDDVSYQNSNFLNQVIDHSLELGRVNAVLTKYYKTFSTTEELSLHILFLKFSKIGDGNAEEFIDFCKENMTKEGCIQASQDTLEQNKSALWHELRYARITASKAYEVKHCKKAEGILGEIILGARKIKSTSAMERGIKLEAKVLKIVKEKMQITLKRCGLVLDPMYPLFGASPDSISDNFIIEVKCPASQKAMAQYITKSGQITSKYMGQVQLQMFMTQKQQGLFCVAEHNFEETQNVKIINVDYDEDYCRDLILCCQEYWKNCIFPRIKASFS